MPGAEPPHTPVAHATLDERLGSACAGWVTHVVARPRAVAAAFALAALAALALAAAGLGLNTDENDLFASDLPFFALRERFYRTFPELEDPIVVVVEGATPGLSEDAADALERRLRGDARVGAVLRPGGGPFFERNGLLYLETEEVADLVDQLFDVQPLLAKLSRDPTLRGLFDTLAEAADAAATGDFDPAELARVLDRVTGIVEAQAGAGAGAGTEEADGAPARLSWSEVITGREAGSRELRRVLLVRPRVDFESLAPAEATLLAVRDAAAAVRAAHPGARVRATGVFPLSYEEMDHVSAQVTGAGIASFLFVALLLVFGLGSGRLVLCALATLLAGLALTAGFAAAAVGHLNLISVAFAVLFIGLSIDFAIHLCVRFREDATAGAAPADALEAAARDVGGSLVLCAATTAIGFLAFVPTDYRGVAELGLIAGAGMGISLVCNLTLLPALVVRFVPAAALRPPRPLPRAVQDLLALPVTRTGWVLAATGALAAASLLVAPRIGFDPNPLRVRDPTTPSVAVMEEMLADGDATLWNLSATAPDADAAARLATRLEALPEVDRAVTLADFVPDAQAEKRALLDEAAFVLLPTLETSAGGGVVDAATLRAAADGLRRSLDALDDAGGPALRAAAPRARTVLADLAARADEPALRGRVHRALVGDLARRLAGLRAALEPERVTPERLPESVTGLLRGRDGRLRVEVVPAGNLNDTRALEAYVGAVREVHPDAFGEALVILESGRVVVRSLREAGILAGGAIALLLLGLWRSPRDAALVALPLGLAVLFTAAASVPLGIPFNFANVIVIPLLLGMGVDTGIHLVHRLRLGAPADGNLLRTSTARGVLLSALTTAASFGMLGISSHLGMASLGRLLALGIAAILLANLGVLPALAKVVRRPGGGAGPAW